MSRRMHLTSRLYPEEPHRAADHRDAVRAYPLTEPRKWLLEQARRPPCLMVRLLRYRALSEAKPMKELSTKSYARWISMHPMAALDFLRKTPPTMKWSTIGRGPPPTRPQPLCVYLWTLGKKVALPN